METTVAYAPKISSGIDVVDEAWGGLYQGASYLIYGRTASGRGLLPLVFTRAGVDEGHGCLYVTSDTFDDLVLRARTVDVNLQTWVDAGLLEILQIPALGSADEAHDELLSQALSSLVSAVEEKRPHRVVIDTFMPFVTFRSFGRFRTSFISMLERVDASNATLVLVMAEPANEESEKVIEFMRSQTTAALRVELTEANGRAARRKLSLIPSIGHAGQAAVKYWHAPEPAPTPPDPDHGRRFRFAEESEDEEEHLSPSDALWDSGEAPGETQTDHPESEINGSSRTKQDYLITPFRLGRKEGETPFANRQSGIVRSRESEMSVQPIPLGRLRERSAERRRDQPEPRSPRREPFRTDAGPDGRTEQDQPLTATTASDRSREQPGRSTGDGPQAKAAPASRVSASTEERDEAVSHTNRESFRARLQQRFLRSSVNDVPFLLVAMRMDRREEITSRPFDFEFILDLVNELLREQDDVYVDLERERLIVMLADTEAEGSRRFFAELRRRLREEAPHQADHLLQSVSAIVVPNGRPFQNAEEFLTYALSEA